jgi:hypothetical protein
MHIEMILHLLHIHSFHPVWFLFLGRWCGVPEDTDN